MGTYEEFMKAWNYIWAMGNEVIEYSPFLAERDVPKTDKLHEELIKLKASFEDAQEEWWRQHNDKRRESEELVQQSIIRRRKEVENSMKKKMLSNKV